MKYYHIYKKQLIWNVKTEYINILKEKYDAEVKQDEFKNVQNANQWIEDKTLGIIKGMLKYEMVQNPANVMLIINALAEDIEWVTEFDCEDIRGLPFYLKNSQEMKATMMYRRKICRQNSILLYKRRYHSYYQCFKKIMMEFNLNLWQLCQMEL